MTYVTKFSQILAWLAPFIGKDNGQRLEAKLFYFSCAMVFLAGLITLGINIYQYFLLDTNDILAIYSSLFLIALGIGLRLIGQRFKNPENLAVVLVVIPGLLISLNWLTNQGSQGSLPLWFSPLFILAAAILSGRLLLVATIYLVAIIALSIGLEWQSPQLVVIYASSEAQLFDKVTVLLLTSLVCFLVTLFITYAHRQERNLALTIEIEKLRKESALDAALLETNQLKSLLPMCAWCKKIRDTEGEWSSFEEYLAQHNKTQITHGMCPSCLSTAEKEIPRK